ncbi:MAG: polysaccharide biosynthesis protein [Clostridia bacterium]|nr:polysaccharide biosynthesis protein [Clostridia bacterium]
MIIKKKKEDTKKEGFGQAVVTLIFSQILIKILGLIYTLYLTNREGFGDRGNGILASGYQIYAMLLTISSIGVPSAISKLVSERVAIGDHKGAHRIFKIAFATFAVIGLIGSIALFFGAGVIANNWLQIPEAEMTLVALSPAIFFVAIASVMRGYFNGRQSMKTTARSQTLEQVFKTLLTILIVEIIAVCSNVSTEWMAAGANLATTLATFLGFSYLYLYYKTKRKEISKDIKQSVNYSHERVKSIIKKILLVSIPIALTAILSSINKNIDSFTVVRSLKEFMPEDVATAQYGILGGKVDTLTNLPLAINVAFATALVPAIAAAKAKRDSKTIKEKTSFSLLVSMLIGLPCTVGMFIFAGPILNLLFPNASSGTVILQISSLAILFTILDQTINGALQGYGKLMIPTISLGAGVLVKLILNLILVPIPSIGVNGAALATVGCHLVAFIIAITSVIRSFKLNLKLSKFVIKPIIATSIMGICSYCIYLLLNGIIAGRLATILAMISAIIVYLLAIVALKIFSKEEILSLPMGEKIFKVLEKMKIY